MKHYVAIICLVTSAGAFTGTTQEAFEKYSADLKEAWTKFPTEKQKTIRLQVIQDLNTAFNRDVAKTEPAARDTVKKSFDTYLDNIDKAFVEFPVLTDDKYKAERGSLTKAAGAIFKKEMAVANDAREIRPAQKCFELLLALLEQSRDHLIPVKYKDVRTDVYASANAVFQMLLKDSTAPEGDVIQKLDENLKEVKKRFPTTSPAFAERNQPLYTMLEAAAKAVKNRPVKK